MKNKPKMGNLTEKTAQLAFGKYENRETNPKKQARNEQIYTKARPNFVLQ